MLSESVVLPVTSNVLDSVAAPVNVVAPVTVAIPVTIRLSSISTLSLKSALPVNVDKPDTDEFDVTERSLQTTAVPFVAAVVLPSIVTSL